ncbi:MAG: hypothetical protein P1P88_02485 [Bacteroidales bacterium]|nr:hypothetical protein [Bacteroidales bacterium]
MKKALTYLVLFLISSTAWSQNFPVQSNVNITPPYSVYLSDYASMTSNKLLVTLMLKDINQSDIQVKLRLTIKGNGIEIRTKADYQPQPLLLQGGAPLLISGTDLESYLNPANLDFSGTTKSEFTKTGKLPEGVYQFIVEAVEYRRNVTVSNAGMTIGWLVLNDPPRWTLPMANSLLTATYPQNIFFSWMPMSTASPNSAFTTEYEFTIVELWPDSRSPGDAINSSIPLYQVTTSNTSLVYGPAEPELTPGRKYVCRLRAYDTEGRDLFKNKGYSEILVFTFGQSCKPPNIIQHQVLGPEDARVNWTSLPGNTQFVLSYAEQNADGTWSNWYHNETLMPTSNIKGLKAEHSYRYQLKAICGTLESEYSEIKQFNTPAPDTTLVECGKDISIPKVDDSPPLPMLKVGDFINVGGFEARIIEVEGSNGTFSGKCVVNVKTFGGVRILSEFENISVNESHQVTAGAINSVKGELNIIGLDEIIKEVVDVFDNTETDPNVGDPYQPGDPVTIVIEGQTVTVSGDTTFTTPEGTEVIVTLSGQPPIVTVDGEPTEVTTNKLDFDNPNTVTNDGNLAHASSDTTAYSINYVQFKEFIEPDDKTPGFDAYDHGIAAYRNEYKDKKVNDQEYIIPWQSVEANGKPARVNMLIDTKVPDSIQTRLKVEMKGSPLNFLASPDGDTIRILNLVGQSNKDLDLITASYIKDNGDEVPVGYLNLMSYESQSKNVVIVPVDGEFKYQASALQAFLDKVYAPAMVAWDVQVADKPLEVEYNEGEANGLNTSRTFFSSFNEEMKKVIKAMENRGDYKPDKATYYLFVMNKAENESLNGLMPFNSNYGFLFTGDGPDQTHLFRTIAHELGHGAFKLRHNFDQFSTIEKRSTLNLMDYTNTPETATVLRKFQWDEIINPRLVALGWGEELYAEDGEGGYSNLPITETVWYNITPPGKVTFLAPSGLPFSAENVSRILLTTGNTEVKFDNNGVISKDGTVTLSADRGVVVAYEVNNIGEKELWTASTSTFSREVKDNETGELKTVNYTGFYGYKNDIYESPATDSKSPSESYFEFIYCYSDGHIGIYELDLIKDLNVFLFPDEKTNYTGSGVFVSNIEEFLLKFKLGSEVYEFKDFSKIDIYGHEVWAKFNYFGNKGLLQKVIRGDETLLLYTIKDKRGKKHHYSFNQILKKWQDFTFGETNIEDIFDYDVIETFYNDFAELGHGIIDIIGFIPLAGEIADAINGAWYYLEGNTTDALLSCGSMLPIIGDVAAKGGKYTIKIVKGLNKAAKIEKIFEFTEDGYKSFSKINDLLKAAKNVARRDECIEIFGKLLEKFPDKTVTIEKFATKITDVDKLKAVLTKIDNLPISPKNLRASLLDDLAKNSKFADDFLAKVADNEGLVESWKIVGDIGTNPAWRTHLPLLESINKIKADPNLLSKIGGDSKLIDILKKNSTSPYTGCNCGQKWLPNIEETVESLSSFANKFDQSKVNSMVAGLTNEVSSFRRGALQELKGIRNQIDEITDVQVSLPNTSRIADAKLTNGRWKEIKSTNNILETVGTTNLDQFKAYIKNVTDIDQLKYSFDKELLKTPTSSGGLGLVDDVSVLNHAREQMRLVFRDNAKAIFDANPSVFTKYNNIDDWEDLYDLASKTDFVDNSIIKNLVEIQ